MIRTLHYAIETGKEESGFELVSFFFAVLMSIIWFITLLYSLGDCTHGPGSVDYFLTHNKWISFTGCITIVLGWVFYCQYDKMREYWVKTPGYQTAGILYVVRLVCLDVQLDSDMADLPDGMAHQPDIRRQYDLVRQMYQTYIREKTHDVRTV